MVGCPKNICALALCAGILIMTVTASTQIFDQEIPDNVSTNLKDQTLNARPHELVIQLAIFCDPDFSILFQGNKNKMFEYWKTVIYHVHIRHQSLPNFNISFQITSLEVLNEPFIERMKDKSGQVNTRRVLLGMPKWLGPQINQLPSFDIALLALGAEARDTVSAETQGSICLGKSIPGEWVTNIAISVRTSDVAQETSQSIRRVLGASFDDGHYSLKQECRAYIDGWTQEYNKHSINLLKYGEFTDCFNRIMSDLFANSLPPCLKPQGSEAKALYDSTSLVPGHISVHNQCRVRANFSEVVVVKHFDDLLCSWIKCRSMENLDEKPEILLPLDGSPCGFEKRGACYHGSCLKHEIKLVNVQTGKCIDGDDEFNKIKTLNQCSFGKLPQTEFINLMAAGRYGVILRQQWTWRCLQVDKDGFLKMGACQPSPNIGWEIIKLNTPTETDFMLRHLGTKSCAKVVTCNSSHLVSSSKCNMSDFEMRWNLVLGNGTALTHENYGVYIRYNDMFKNNERDSSSDSLVGMTIFWLCLFLLVILLTATAAVECGCCRFCC